MIEDPPLLTVRRNFERPTADQVAAFRDVPTGNIVDAMNGTGAMDYRIKPIAESGPFVGVAVPCEDGPADNLATFGGVDIAQPGDVIISSTGGFTGAAVIGDLLLGMMKNAGCAAFVTDGLVRDIAGIRAVGLPCYAAGVTANSPVRNGPGTVGLPVVAGGVQIGGGDIVAGDEDGVVVVPFAKVSETIAMLTIVRKAEADLEAKVKDGLRIPDFIQSRIDAGLYNEID